MSTSDPAKPAAVDLVRVRQDLLSAPASRRVDVLVEQPNVRQVLRRLPPQDLLAAIHAKGAADSLELIELLPSKQVQSFIDLESWQRDRIEPRSMAAWMSLLYAANPERALGQIMGLDSELVTLFLKIHTRVFDLAHEPGPAKIPELSLRTPDNRYLVTFVPPPHPEGRDKPDPTDALGTEVARKIVQGLIAREPFTASRYLEAVRWELPSELEEACLRWRRGRLADLGFYDLYEALGIYSPVDLSRRPRTRAVDVLPNPDDPDTALALFVDEYGGAPLLREALGRLPAAKQDSARRQLAALANRVVAANGLAPGDLEALTSCAVEATATVNLGLEYLSKGDRVEAAAVLEASALAEVFRTGHTLTWQLGEKARKVRARLSFGDGHHLLPTGVLEVFSALCERVPKLYAGLVDPSLVDRVPFETLAQLARAAEVVAETAFLTAFLLDVLSLDPARVPELTLTDTNMVDAIDLDIDGILTTALCRDALDGALDPTPFAPADLERVRSACSDGGEELQHKMAEQVVTRAKGRLPLPGAPDRHALETRARTYCGRVAQRLVEDIGEIRGPLDPRLVTALVCRLS